MTLPRSSALPLYITHIAVSPCSGRPQGRTRGLAPQLLQAKAGGLGGGQLQSDGQPTQRGGVDRGSLCRHGVLQEP